MENLTYIGLSRQMALYDQMNMTANNVANMNTPGFKSQHLMFKEYLTKTSEAGGEVISQVQDYGSYRDLTEGPLTQTANKLDTAIHGDGYFAVQTPQGIRYTRDGSFSLDGTGNIVTQSGYQLMNGNDHPLTLPPGASQINIAKDGSVSTEKGAVGTLKVVTFSDEQALVPIGSGLYDAQNAPEQPVASPQVIQGMLEGSNVQPITEMNTMIQTSRMYEAAQHMLLADHDDQRTMIQKLTQN